MPAGRVSAGDRAGLAKFRFAAQVFASAVVYYHYSLVRGTCVLSQASGATTSKKRSAAMLRVLIVSACLVLVMGQTQNPPRATPTPADTQPTTRPAPTNTVLRRPAQAEMLKGLLQRGQRPTPIRPEEPGGTATPAGTTAGEGLLLEGTFLVERPARLVQADGRAKLVFQTEGQPSGPRTMELIPNQLLEAMERESTAGFAEFIVTAEVTRYKGANYLLLRKILRRVEHGNLEP